MAREGKMEGMGSKWDVEVNRGMGQGARRQGSGTPGRRVRMQEGGRDVADEIERVWGVQGVGNWDADIDRTGWIRSR